jgi:hypothetical protein
VRALLACRAARTQRAPRRPEIRAAGPGDSMEAGSDGAQGQRSRRATGTTSRSGVGVPAGRFLEFRATAAVEPRRSARPSLSGFRHLRGHPPAGWTSSVGPRSPTPCCGPATPPGQGAPGRPSRFHPAPRSRAERPARSRGQRRPAGHPPPIGRRRAPCRLSPTPARRPNRRAYLAGRTAGSAASAGSSGVSAPGRPAQRPMPRGAAERGAPLRSRGPASIVRSPGPPAQ